MYPACKNLHGTEEKAKFCSRKARLTLTDFISNFELTVRAFYSLFYSKYLGEVYVGCAFVQMFLVVTCMRCASGTVNVQFLCGIFFAPYII